MNPAFSVIFFTTLTGAAQGLVVALAIAQLAGTTLPRVFVLSALAVCVVLLLIGLASSTLHLGRPERAWRAALMWRTSWLSREVIVLPAFIAVVCAWLAIEWTGTLAGFRSLFAGLAIALALVLWLCTAMIYACLKFIQEWAHPLTLVNYVLLGLASGVVLAATIAALTNVADFARTAALWGLVLTIAAAIARLASLVRNARIRPRSTLQSATGVRGLNLRQTSMGMSAGAFNTREFFHGRSAWLVARVKHVFLLLTFVLPALFLGIALATGAPAWLPLAMAVQYVGLVAERWFFFAQARHPQNLYYQVVS